MADAKQNDDGESEGPDGSGELFLIDGNSLAYRAFFALPESMATSDGRPTNAIYGLASHGKLASDFKPHNATKVPDLFLAGNSANPGPDVPMVLMSGVTAAKSAAEFLGLPALDLDATSFAPRPDEVAQPSTHALVHAHT